ncbi:RNA polymerase sigma factor [Fibrisoma montanum]|uniref:RNA polymerase sigma factor n=1 Tax=Fibrisoma montanum TaxID=2305895 RepID=UPI0018F54324|nr:sigma-70 family RNA polymerase sigma factor [Fibrisoma montanum]
MKENVSHVLLPHLFRLEYTKLTAVLCRQFGLKHIEIAEDIASDTFLKATEVWSLHGPPENPTAWLYTVAKNKTKDYLKRNAIFESNVVKTIMEKSHDHCFTDIDFTEQNFRDSQLAMMFAVCNPAIAKEAQVCLALQILCGFSVEEIANAFLSNKETIKKRLFRAREHLRIQNFKIEELRAEDIGSRLDTVLTTLYLLFNEGYFSKSNDNLVRKDLCAEAMRLTLTLTENAHTNNSKVNALLALQCFQSSRLEARIVADGAVLFEEQDTALWNKDLINKGNYYLVNAYATKELSKYHLEASIAYWHTTNIDNGKWKHILELYNELLLWEYSSGAALNRTFAFAKIYGNEKAINEAAKLGLPTNSYYHSLLGYLYSAIDTDKAIDHYNQSIRLTNSPLEKKQLGKTIATLAEKRNSS